MILGPPASCYIQLLKLGVGLHHLSDGSDCFKDLPVTRIHMTTDSTLQVSQISRQALGECCHAFLTVIVPAVPSA